MKQRGGFTLIEVLVALGIISVVLLPTSLWLYSSKTSRAALEKFHATQALEMQMNRAFLLRQDKNWNGDVKVPEFFRLEINVENKDGETRLLGMAKNRDGKIVCHLESDFFSGVTP